MPARKVETIGGVGGVALGSFTTVAWSHYRHWPSTTSPLAIVGGILVAGIIGAIAGLYPANRAARLAPTEALRAI